MLLQHRVSQYAKLYNQFKEEKNKYVRLKQIASQTISDLGEQLNILGNEMEIQRSIADSKDRLLTKARINVSNGSKTRERLCNEISKFTCKRHQISQKYEDNKLELTNLSQMIEFQQNTLLGLKKGLEKASQRRIILGIQLLEQEKVLLNYCEQTKNLEAAITNRNMAMETMETDMRELKIKINEEKRQIGLKKGDGILKRKIEEEITMLQIELSEARKKTLKSVNCTLEYRELKGEDLPTSELVKKMKQLEVNLAKRESQLLEKELLVEQVTQLSKSLREQAESCRLHSLSVAKKLNETRTNMININLSLMAASAEFSMKEAVALSEQQQIKEKDLQLSEARKWMLKNENCTLEFRESKVENLLTSELEEKMDELEVNVAERESQLLEKGLLVEQVTQLSEPPGEQAESCRLPSLSVAKKMDKCQWEAGQAMPPYLDIEEGYRRMLRDKKRRQREKEEKKLAEESKWRLLPNGVYTTAEARPNAYIPENDLLGLPKPFGRFPPIKPCPKGAYMRHYRNPTIRPWEI
ncbi:coiled-coil domain-containing protein 146 isoform X1 [Cyprinodon tularosa]|uniref:coiled-coil domain-containing protein 146 isoform X1 n=1 Tax=Cyprinodon tularosa TaxID=77115 RepID=UPI0018E22BFB|nr:coiled-coil domain-containing protein 146 isoform X1 [Cyprinodon tularosa]